MSEGIVLNREEEEGEEEERKERFEKRSSSYLALLSSSRVTALEGVLIYLMWITHFLCSRYKTCNYPMDRFNLSPV